MIINFDSKNYYTFGKKFKTEYILRLKIYDLKKTL